MNICGEHNAVIYANSLPWLAHFKKCFVVLHLQINFKINLEKVIADFDSLLNETQNDPSNEQIRDFIDEYFTEPDSEFEHWTPSDWKET